MSKTKQIQYRAMLDKFEKTYGTEQTRNQKNPVVFNVTGPYRNKLYGSPKISTVERVMFVAMFAIVSWLTSVFVGGFVTFSVWVAIQYYVDNLVGMFDGEILEIDGVLMGVVIPTQTKEGELESRNFVEINDRGRLTRELNKTNIIYSDNKVVTWSFGSSTGQCIDGQPLAPFSEVEMGVESFSDEDIEKFLDAHAKRLGHDGVLVMMNAIGYGVNENNGVVYSDNTIEYDTILDNVVPRMIGVTGNNDNAMRFVSQIAKFHKWNKYDFTLAIVPRGDKNMPQGGSHSKQRVLENFIHKETVVVIEVSGKQTKRFELQSDACSPITDSSEQICKCIKETKIVDERGKTYGSEVVFGQWIE
jgi:hypothetical protein